MRIEWHRDAIGQIAKSEQVQQLLAAKAERVAAAARAAAPYDPDAPEPHLRDSIKVESGVGRRRAWSRVVADVPHAAAVASTNPFLTGALDAARHD